MIQLNWRSVDLPASSTTSSSPGARTGSTSPTSTSTSTSSDALGPTGAAQQPAPSGLSTGAKAGIGVGAALGALALLALAVFLYRRRKGVAKDASGAHPTAHELAGRKGPYDTAELPTGKDGASMPPPKPAAELGSRELHELHA